jgi:hypothetical protein
MRAPCVRHVQRPHDSAAMRCVGRTAPISSVRLQGARSEPSAASHAATDARVRADRQAALIAERGRPADGWQPRADPPLRAAVPVPLPTSERRPNGRSEWHPRLSGSSRPAGVAPWPWRGAEGALPSPSPERAGARRGMALDHPMGLLVQFAGLVPSSRRCLNRLATPMVGWGPNSSMSTQKPSAWAAHTSCSGRPPMVMRCTTTR